MLDLVFDAEFHQELDEVFEVFWCTSLRLGSKESDLSIDKPLITRPLSYSLVAYPHTEVSRLKKLSFYQNKGCSA